MLKKDQFAQVLAELNSSGTILKCHAIRAFNGSDVSGNYPLSEARVWHVEAATLWCDRLFQGDVGFVFQEPNQLSLRDC